MDAKRFKDARELTNLTLKQLIDRYTEEIGAEHPFGKSKTAVLHAWRRGHGTTSLADVTDDYLTKFVRDRPEGGASRVTISMDLTYLAGVLKTAKGLWKLPVSLEPIEVARANMGT